MLGDRNTMRTRHVTIRRVARSNRVLAWLPIASIALALAAGQIRPAAAAERVVFEEPFRGKLQDGWSWVREDPQGWRLDNGSLSIRTSTGGLWIEHNNSRNLLLRAAPSTEARPFAQEVLVKNRPANAFEHAGLVWYADDDNYVALMKEKVGNRPIVQLVSETKRKPKVGFAEKPYAPEAVWLRMEITARKARGLYREADSGPWTLLGECDLPVTPAEPRVGLITGYAAKNAEQFSRFSDYRILQASP